MRLWVYAVRRIALLVPLFIGVATVTFVLFSALPVADRTAPFSTTSPPPTFGPTACPRNGCGPYIDPNAVAFLQLNQPVPVQWAVYVYHALTLQWGHVDPQSTLGDGNAGIPPLKGQAVASVLADFLPYSLELILLTMLFTVAVFLPIQTRATVTRGRTADHTGRVLTLLGFGIPGFVIGVIVLFLASWLLGGGAIAAASPICPGGTPFLEFYGSWPVANCALWGSNLGRDGLPTWLVNGYQSTPTGFPTIDALVHGNGWLALDTLFRMVLPALVMALGAIAAAFRFGHYHPIERTDLELVRAARAKGLPEAEVVGRHARRYSRSVLFSALGPALLAILGSLPILETVFDLNGVGRLFVAAFYQTGGRYDFGVLFGAVLVFALLTLVANVVLDVVRAYLDPRFRHEWNPSSVGVSR